MIDPTVRPTKVASASDATGLVDTGQLVSLLKQTQAGAGRDARPSGSAAIKLAKIAEEPKLEELIHCGYVQTTRPGLALRQSRRRESATSTPTSSARPRSIFTATELNQARFQKTAAVMKLVVDGYAGAGTIEQGGYDYHDGTRATGEHRDFQAGQMMGADARVRRAQERRR